MDNNRLVETDGEKATGMLVCLLVFAFMGWAAVAGAPQPFVNFCRLYLLGAALSGITMAWIGARADRETSVMRELGYLLVSMDIFWLVLAWPLTLPMLALLRRSAREHFLTVRFQEIMQMQQGIHYDTADELTRHDANAIEAGSDQVADVARNGALAVGMYTLRTCRAGAVASTVLATGVYVAKPAHAESVAVQADLRSVSTFAEDDTKLGSFARVTLTGKHWFTDVITTTSRGYRSHDVLCGPGLKTTWGDASVRLNLALGGTITSTEQRKWMLGPQLFVSGTTHGHGWFVATPILRYEEQVEPTEVRAFNWRSESFSQVHERWWLGGEFGVRKVFEGATTWSGGPALRYKVGRFTLETAAHRDQDDTWSWRNRVLIQLR